MTISVLRIDSRDKYGWVHGQFTHRNKTRFFEAKVFDLPSDYGIDCGRVSKMAIGRTPERDVSAPYAQQLVFTYDRDGTVTLPDHVRALVQALEALPKLTDDPIVREAVESERRQAAVMQELVKLARENA